MQNRYDIVDTVELNQLFLFLHLLGAFFSFGVITKSLHVLFLNDISSFKNLGRYLWIGTFYQTITGIFMIFSTPQISLLSFCTKLGFYLGVIFFLQGLFYFQGRKQSILPLKLD